MPNPGLLHLDQKDHLLLCLAVTVNDNTTSCSPGPRTVAELVRLKVRLGRDLLGENLQGARDLEETSLT
jgi:hypothetical protein